MIDVLYKIVLSKETRGYKVEWTKTEKILLDGLIYFGLDKEEVIGTMMFLQTEQQQIRMIDYLMNNRNATSQDILKETMRIIKDN